ncbi:hypothetical protein PHYPSEUDO_003329 [Phytophthora pseudosyringae]|uniref:Uncharacterized protein n=1 Tax=Phytophthora pseudosyringae TaxID=221518 RepID=A0A8T1VRC9_9STRA|nr:hypothetical protein PHYPSEUDO_003329 [Phytophthora pseudosyringae]
MFIGAALVSWTWSAYKPTGMSYLAASALTAAYRHPSLPRAEIAIEGSDARLCLRFESTREMNMQVLCVGITCSVALGFVVCDFVAETPTARRIEMRIDRSVALLAALFQPSAPLLGIRRHSFVDIESLP